MSPAIIASEAKQSTAEIVTLDCFVASLLAMTEYAAPLLLHIEPPKEQPR
jgi:hypothetical protein